MDQHAQLNPLCNVASPTPDDNTAQEKNPVQCCLNTLVGQH